MTYSIDFRKKVLEVRSREGLTLKGISISSIGISSNEG